MSAVEAHDAAFGPMGSVGAATYAPPPEYVAKVKEVQNLLNLRGFGPVAVTGVVNGETGDAYIRFKRTLDPGWQVKPFNADEALTELRNITIQGPGQVGIMQGAATSNVPFWKNPKFLWAAAGVAAVVGYIAYRTGKLDTTLQGLGLADAPKPKRKRQLSEHDDDTGSSKCSRLPDVDFDAEALPLEPAKD